MGLILSLETSTTVCSVALTDNGILVGTEKLLIEKSHSNLLTLMVENLMSHAGTSLEQLDAIAVSKGPGSYTGLRIGVSTAKGLCYALDKPLIGINTLQAMAQEMAQFNTNNALLCPMIDARRMEVYTAVFESGGQEMEPTSAMILDETSFDETLKASTLLFFGNGSEKLKPLLSKNDNAKFVDGLSPSASAIGVLAEQALQNKEFEDVAYFEPFYLKDFVATVPKKVL